MSLASSHVARALSGRSPFTLSEHVSTEVDATEADATLGWYTAPGAGQTLAVVELKDARTSLDRRQLSRPDRLTPIDQARELSSPPWQKATPQTGVN